MITEAKENRRPDKRREGKISKLQSLILEKKQDILGFEEKLMQLPDKVSILDVIGGNLIGKQVEWVFDLMPAAVSNTVGKAIYGVFGMVLFASDHNILKR